MCVTSAVADMGQTSVFTHASMPTTEQGKQWIHYTAYQNKATNLSDQPNCMLLHIPCQGLPWLVEAPTKTRHLMEDVTLGLEPLSPQMRGGYVGRGGQPVVTEYGDYHVVLTSTPGDIPVVLDQVPEERRPLMSEHFEELIWWNNTHFPGDGFVLACFNGNVNPTHPIVVGYHPDSDDVLFAPGLDGHDGNIPTIGEPMQRDFRVAFGVQGLDLPNTVAYRDQLDESDLEDWAPTSVAGFWDNRSNGPNTDYVVPLLSLQEGMDGGELIAELVV